MAGKVGFCNHVFALMFKICKYTLFSSTTTKIGANEQTDQAGVGHVETEFGKFQVHLDSF